MVQDHGACALDPARPCNSSSRAKNRYTRQHIEKVAKKCNIQNINKMTITELCDAIHKFVQSNTTPLVVGKRCSPNTTNALKPNYECNPKTGRWIKRKDVADYYFRYELEKLNETQLRNIAENLGIEVEEGEDQLSIIHEILEKQYPVVQDSQRAKNEYVKKFKKALLKIFRYRISKPKLKYISIYIFDTAIKQGGVVSLLTQKKPIRFISYERHFKGLPEIMYSREYVATDVDGLRRNQTWFALQKAYQMTLPFLKQLIILSYTHGGDQMIHTYLDNGFQISYSFKNDKYRVKNIYPLYPVFVYLLTSVSEHRRREWIGRVKSMVENASVLSSVHLKDLLQKCGAFDEMYSSQNVPKRGDNLFKNYKEVVDKFFRQQPMKSDFYDMLMKEYVHLIKQLIHDAPPLLNHLVVYKGVKSVSYMDFTEKNIYTNKRFISTTFDAAVALESLFTNPKCCVQKITLLKGTRCLYPMFSYYTEYEILLPPERKMYASSKLYVPKHGTKKETMNLVIAN